MARRDIEWVQGRYYHIYNRGTEGISICRCDADYKNVISRMEKYAQAFNIAVIAFCLMPNHYHWLIRQCGELDGGLLPQRVFNGYVRYFNNRYNRKGTMFQSPFEAIPVNDDVYLRHLPRYIHGNPVKDTIAMSPELWPYSNYHEWMGLRDGILVDHDFINEYYPDRNDYKTSLLDYLTGIDTLPEAMSNHLKSLYGK